MAGLGSAYAISFVQVADREAGVAWYRDVLGLSHLRADEFGDEFALGDGAGLRLTALPGFEAAGHPVLGWGVTDIGSAAADLRAKGVSFEIYEGLGQDGDGLWTAPDGQTQLIWFKDCAGNVLCLSSRT